MKTVEELIKELQAINPKAIVITRAYEEGYDSIAGIEEIKVAPWKDSAWYYGDYKEPEDNEETVQAVFIR